MSFVSKQSLFSTKNRQLSEECLSIQLTSKTPKFQKSYTLLFDLAHFFALITRPLIRFHLLEGIANEIMIWCFTFLIDFNVQAIFCSFVVSCWYVKLLSNCAFSSNWAGKKASQESCNFEIRWQDNSAGCSYYYITKLAWKLVYNTMHCIHLTQNLKRHSLK